MIRTALLCLTISAAACKREQPPSAGPPYSPAAANTLKAHTPDCEIQPGPEGGETRACRGRQATMRLELDRARHVRELDMTITARYGLGEAWTLFQNVLPAVAGPALLDAVHKKLSGASADDVVDGARITAAVEGQRYSVKLTWGR